VSKILAAVEARENPDFVIIARTDARAVEGMDAAVARCRAYVEAGADVLFYDGLESMDDLRRATGESAGPVLANMVEGGKTPYLSAPELEELGYQIVIYPLALMWGALRRMMELTAEIKATGTLGQETRQSMVTFAEFNEFMGVRELFDLERKYAA
jgi:2-methylisocitrate lyase-like PEP mutase family enzyme